MRPSRAVLMNSQAMAAFVATQATVGNAFQELTSFEARLARQRFLQGAAPSYGMNRRPSEHRYSPHQGKGECERRVRQRRKIEARRAAEA